MQFAGSLERSTHELPHSCCVPEQPDEQLLEPPVPGAQIGVPPVQTVVHPPQCIALVRSVSHPGIALQSACPAAHAPIN